METGNELAKKSVLKRAGVKITPPSLHAHPPSIYPSIQLNRVLLFFLLLLFLCPLCPRLFSGERQALSPPDTASTDQCWPSLQHCSNTHTNCRHGLKTPSFSRVNPCLSICLRLYLPVSPITIRAFLSVSVCLPLDHLCAWFCRYIFSVHLGTPLCLGVFSASPFWLFGLFGLSLCYRLLILYVLMTVFI